MAKLKGILKSLLQEFGSTDTNKGTLEYEGTLEVGTEVTINDEPAADGEYETEAQVIVVADGKVTEIRDKEVEEPATEEPTEVEAKMAKVAQAYSETYDEKERKIYDAIKNATGVEYFWLTEAADDYAVYCIWVDEGDKYFRVSISWDENGDAVVGDIEEVKPAFVPAEEEPAATEEVAMAEDEPATEEPKTEEPKADEPEERDLAAEIDALKAELDELKATVNELKNEPAQEPIAESFQKVIENKPTGNAKFDRALKRFSYMKN